jgi:hypothetical protein
VGPFATMGVATADEFVRIGARALATDALPPLRRSLKCARTSFVRMSGSGQAAKGFPTSTSHVVEDLVPHASVGVVMEDTGLRRSFPGTSLALRSAVSHPWNSPVSHRSRPGRPAFAEMPAGTSERAHAPRDAAQSLAASGPRRAITMTTRTRQTASFPANGTPTHGAEGRANHAGRMCN